jgi:hypothetical protein
VDQLVYDTIKALADRYARDLKHQVDLRIEEMKEDDTSHYLLYRVLGVTNEEGNLIDLYQNKGRFLYKYAGVFLEEAAVICMKHRYPDSGKVRIPNTHGSRPKTFEIDCLVDNMAHEIKWRDATTDGDHITKEHTRVKVIQERACCRKQFLRHALFANKSREKRQHSVKKQPSKAKRGIRSQGCRRTDPHVDSFSIFMSTTKPF